SIPSANSSGGSRQPRHRCGQRRSAARLKDTCGPWTDPAAKPSKPSLAVDAYWSRWAYPTPRSPNGRVTQPFCWPSAIRSAPRFIGRARITAGYVLQLNGVPAHHYQRLVGDGLALLERCHDPVSQIVGLLVASRSARAGGNPDRARERLDSCSRIARSVGAWGLEEYANARLEDLGDRVPETACVPARLTDSEWRIAKSVMGGLTNRQVADQLFITL